MKFEDHNPFFRLGLLWRTVRHLKLIQILGRIWFKTITPKVITTNLPTFENFKYLSTFPARRKISITGQYSWDLLNLSGDLEQLGWEGHQRSKLWRYNQHYFDDLNAFKASERHGLHRELIDLWIVDNSNFQGVGWEPYPTSLRIVNWIKWVSDENKLSQLAVRSLALQGRWLSKRLEWHLLGNHLLANSKALIFVGIFFSGVEASAWISRGISIFRKQIKDQVLEDGHFELSPMYHAIVLEDLLDVINICRANRTKLTDQQYELVGILESLVPKMLYWLASVSHPDGKISFLMMRLLEYLQKIKNFLIMR